MTQAPAMNNHKVIISYIALGSNLQSPLKQVQNALQRLEQLPTSTLLEHSSLYQTSPVGGPLDQPDYINAVAKIATQLPAQNLLFELQTIEQEFGRIRLERNGPRTLDLDILLYGDEIIDTEQLTIPHPRLMERAFVLFPLTEIAANLVLPDGTRIANFLTASLEGQCKRIK